MAKSSEEISKLKYLIKTTKDEFVIELPEDWHSLQ